MKVLVSGASGLVGTELCDFLTRNGHDVVKLVRKKQPAPGTVRWNIKKGLIDTEALEAEAPDAVIHLAGESIVGLGWSDAKKEKILNSRVHGTTLLAKTIANMENKPHTFICASAIGYYGHRGDETLTETSDAGCEVYRQPRKNPFFLCDEQWGPLFLSETCKAWEQSAAPAQQAGIRTVFMRTGIVLSSKGGALKAMLPAFKLGVAGPLGSGNQYMSWVSLPDLVSMYAFALTNTDIKGPVNAVGPNPSTNKEFTNTLSKRAFALPFLGEFANFLPAPAMAIKASPFGEMANALVLSSTKVKPLVLEEAGYRFVHTELDDALKAVL
jgi:hypothetical protein